MGARSCTNLSAVSRGCNGPRRRGIAVAAPCVKDPAVPTPNAISDPPEILVVEDDEALARQLVDTLTGEGFRVTRVSDGSAALAMDAARFQLVILDLMLPTTYGLDVLERIRSRGSDVPVLVLSGLRESSDVVRAFDLGADDYVTKPFWPEQLLARVRARIRRPTLDDRRGHAVGPLFVDEARHVVVADGATVSLTHNELRLLTCLARRPGTVRTRSRLIEEVFESDAFEDTRRLEVLVSRVRRKLGDHAHLLETVRGTGYRLVDGGSS